MRIGLRFALFLWLGGVGCFALCLGCQHLHVVCPNLGHIACVARFVGNNYFLLAVCRRENKAAVFIERDLRSVYGDGICIFFGNCNRLRFAVGLAVFNAADYRLNIIKRYAVGTKICYVQAYICIVIIREATAMSYAFCLSSRTP